jgi:hypothetical protein
MFTFYSFQIIVVYDKNRTVHESSKRATEPNPVLTRPLHMRAQRTKRSSSGARSRHWQWWPANLSYTARLTWRGKQLDSTGRPYIGCCDVGLTQCAWRFEAGYTYSHTPMTPVQVLARDWDVIWVTDRAETGAQFVLRWRSCGSRRRTTSFTACPATKTEGYFRAACVVTP